MNKKVITGIGLLLVVLAIVLVVVTSHSSGTNELELTYKSNGGVPYKWEYEIKDESIVKFVKTKDITSKEDKQLAGGPIYTNYIFKGLKQGKTTITFKYVSVVDGSVEKKETVTVKVDKYKNISLIVMP